jgi:hypothetical protein
MWGDSALPKFGPGRRWDWLEDSGPERRRYYQDSVLVPRGNTSKTSNQQ